MYSDPFTSLVVECIRSSLRFTEAMKEFLAELIKVADVDDGCSA